MSRYFSDADPQGIVSDFPLGNAFLEGPASLSADALRALQERRFRSVIDRAWQVPFYSRRWREAGLEPGDIRGLDDLERIPPFSKSDLMKSVEAFPPFGDFHGRESMPAGAGPASMVLHTTSGTTGVPQPILFGAYDREVQNALLARAWYLQGLRDTDVVHSVYGFGMVNGGHYIREAMLHFTGALLLSAGTGLETRSEQQVALMKRFGATAMVGFADYVQKLAQVARDAGLAPGRDIPIRMISGHLGQESREAISDAWGGADVFDWYGVGDTGIVAAEGPERDGLWVWEDAQIVEILDPDNGASLSTGERGNICVTCLYKTGIYPIIRFDTKDVSTLLPASGGQGPLAAFRRLAGFQGRSDNMVKLRGVNVYPTAIGAILAEDQALSGEYVCRLRRSDGRDHMVVEAEMRPSVKRDEALQSGTAERLRQTLGVAVDVVLAEPGGTAEATEIDRRQKPIRLIDERHKGVT